MYVFGGFSGTMFNDILTYTLGMQTTKMHERYRNMFLPLDYLIDLISMM